MRLFLTRHGLSVAIVGLGLLCLPMMKGDSAASAEPELKVGTLRVGKILFLGNSITLHAPAPEIGWAGNWGMAASAGDKDYVHQLLNQISQTARGMPKMMVRNIADFERKLSNFDIRDDLKAELAFEADLVILAIGENASSPKTDIARKQFADALGDLLTQLKQHGRPTIVVRSQFWPDAEKDQILKKVSGDAGAIFVDIGKLGIDPANSARSEREIKHAGVAGHPGDKGMGAIADLLWRSIKQAGEAKK